MTWKKKGFADLLPWACDPQSRGEHQSVLMASRMFMMAIEESW
jgi:hypothetical protein